MDTKHDSGCVVHGEAVSTPNRTKLNRNIRYLIPIQKLFSSTLEEEP